MNSTAHETALITARRLRRQARAIVATDVATLRGTLAERPLLHRLRAAVAGRAGSAARSAINLVRDNPAIAGMTLATLTMWLFRKQLGAIAHAELTRIWQAFAHKRK